jgi:hypothetical protein
MTLRGLALFFLLAATNISASDLATIEAHGRVSYKMPDGMLVDRDVSLILPVMGEGSVFLKGGGMTFRANRYFTDHANDRVIFYIVFDEFPGSTEGQIAVFRGTYVRGSNLARYYGDVFLGEERQDDDALMKSLDINGDHGFKHIAGFSFEAPVISSFGPR